LKFRLVRLPELHFEAYVMSLRQLETQEMQSCSWRTVLNDRASCPRLQSPLFGILQT